MHGYVSWLCIHCCWYCYGNDDDDYDDGIVSVELNNNNKCRVQQTITITKVNNKSFVLFIIVPGIPTMTLWYDCA